MISLSGEESVIDFLGSAAHINASEDMRTIKHFSILDKLLANPRISNYTNTITSTTSSTITCPLSCMIVTTTYFAINSTIQTHTHRHQPTAATLPTSTTPLSPNTSYNASPSSIHTHPPSTSTAKSKSTPSDIQSEHLPFTFQVTQTIYQNLNYLCISPNNAPTFNTMQNHPNHRKHLSQENKLKKSKNNKNNNKNPHNFKPRFQPIEHPPTSSRYTATKTDTTTTIQYNPQILKPRATQCTNPTLKTTGTRYILPTSQNQFSTHTKSQHPPPYQPNTNHTSQHTHRSTPSDNHHPFKHRSPSSSPSPLLTLQTTVHLSYHVPSQPAHRTLKNTTYQPSSTFINLHRSPGFPYSPTTQTHTYQHHTTTTTPFPQHTSQTQPKFQHITAQTSINQHHQTPTHYHLHQQHSHHITTHAITIPQTTQPSHDGTAATTCNQSNHHYQPYPVHLTTVHRTPQIHRSPQMHQEKVPHLENCLFLFLI